MKHFTGAKYELVPKIDFEDCGIIAPESTKYALFVAILVLVVPTLTKIQIRLSPHIDVHMEFDVYALHVYYSLRPDVVLRQVAQLSMEGSTLICWFAVNNVLNVLHKILERLQARAK